MKTIAGVAKGSSSTNFWKLRWEATFVRLFWQAIFSRYCQLEQETKSLHLSDWKQDKGAVSQQQETREGALREVKGC